MIERRLSDAVAAFIDTTYRPGTVLDFGCGDGALVGALRQRGIDARGVDVGNEAHGPVPATLRPYCRPASVGDDLAGPYDLIACLNLFQRLAENDAERALDAMAHETDRVLFSSTPTDIADPVFVNVRPPDYWVHAFGARGFFPTPSLGTLVLAPETVLFERRAPVPLTDFGAYERVRYRLARDLQDALRAESAKSAELAAADERVRVLESDFLAAREAIVALEAQITDAHAAIGELQRALVELQESTWWRVGAPVRGAVTRLRATAAAGGRAPLPQESPLVNAAPARKDKLRDHDPLSVEPERVEEGVEAVLEAPDSPPSPLTLVEVVAERFPLLRPLALFPIPDDGRGCLTLIVDGRGCESQLGGADSAFVLAVLLARRLELSLRVVTGDEPGAPEAFRSGLERNELEWHENIEFARFVAGDGGALAHRPRDVFLTTSWRTTWAAVRSIDPRRVVYLLEDDERLSLPAGEEQVVCREVLNNAHISFAVKTSLLYDHFVAEGLEQIARNGVVFEPAFPAETFSPAAKIPGEPRTLCLFASTEQPRTLLTPALTALDEALARGIVDPERWQLSLVGTRVPPVVLAEGATVTVETPGLRCSSLLRRIDVGLSFLIGPQPGDALLAIAACGGVAVTNRYDSKRSLAEYSDNILCVDQSADRLVEGLAAAVELAEDEPTRARNFEAQGLHRTWASLESAVDQLAEHL